MITRLSIFKYDWSIFSIWNGVMGIQPIRMKYGTDLGKVQGKSEESLGKVQGKSGEDPGHVLDKYGTGTGQVWYNVIISHVPEDDRMFT